MDDVLGKPKYEWILDGNDKVCADSLYISGGKDSVDAGCPYWGTADSRDLMLIGDCAGTLSIHYEGGIVDRIPLIYGYTIWWDKAWPENFREPFVNNSAHAQLLQETLQLKKAYEGTYPYLLKIALRNLPVVRLDYRENPDKNGIWQYPELRFDPIHCGAESAGRISAEFCISDDERFFDSHTIHSSDPFPAAIADNLQLLRKILYTFEEDILAVAAADIPTDFKGASIVFTGTPEADIITSIFHHNLMDQIRRVLPDGFVRESAKGALLCYHCGIGTWASNVGAYAEQFYTRNNTINLLADLNHIDLCNKALHYLDEAMMFFPRKYPELNLNGQKIPGHLTVVAQDPLLYSRTLVPVSHWPTNYTFEKFGEHFMDFGNPETDGHGYSMISHWKTWNKAGRPKAWVVERWVYIQEAADYLGWHLDNPDLSFSKYNLLYAESEAGMKDYTLHCNIPCYLGLKMYSDMAERIGENEAALRWKERASGLEEAINVYFKMEDSKFGEVWNVRNYWLSKVSTVLTFFHKCYGNDLADKLPDGWFQRCANTYQKDMQNELHHFAPKGLGYDHNMFVQVSLLLDRMSDASKWMKNLSRLCYAPRLPDSYIVPEGAAVDLDHGIYRRAGDLGNGIQQAETLISIMLCCGIDDTDPTGLKLMPRLPEKFNLAASDYPVTLLKEGQPSSSIIDLRISYPVDNRQEFMIKVSSGASICGAKLRAGPFPAEQESVRYTIDDKEIVILHTILSGDRKWAWIPLPDLDPDIEHFGMVYF